MLAHTIVKYEDSDPSTYLIFLHGILGTRANWRGIARKFVEARNEWGAILVDLREHGESLGLAPPHTLEAAARDVATLEERLAVPVGGVLGHSFGGKVALKWLALRGGAAQCWLIDSSPGAKSLEEGGSITGSVLSILDGLAPTWPSREAFVDAVVEAGQPKPIAQWLAMNLHRNADGTRSFGPDLQAIHALIEDYARTDLWPMVESVPDGASLEVVIGGRSAMFSEPDRARVQAVAAQDSRVHVHSVQDADHWVHVDAPEAVVALLTSRAAAQP